MDKPHHEAGSFNVANQGLVCLPDQPHPALAATTLPELAGWRGPKSCLLMSRKLYKEITYFTIVLGDEHGVTRSEIVEIDVKAS